MDADPSNRRSQRKIRDRSFALVLAGIVALLPPIAGAALVDAKIAGIPVALVYLFVVWVLLIAGAAALSGALRKSESRGSSDLTDSGR